MTRTKCHCTIAVNHASPSEWISARSHEKMMYIANRNISSIHFNSRSIRELAWEIKRLWVRLTAANDSVTADAGEVASNLLGRNYRGIRHPELSRALHPLWFSPVCWDLALEGFSEGNLRELGVLAYQVRKIP